MATEKQTKSKYYLFIDECGDHNLVKYDPAFPVFTLCGILVSRDNLYSLNDDFKKLKHEQDRYNDSLNDANVKNIPRRPGPEGVLRKLVETCKEKGNCPHE